MTGEALAALPDRLLPGLALGLHGLEVAVMVLREASVDADQVASIHGVRRPIAVILDGICPYCDVRLEARHMDRSWWGWCRCCGWWWRGAAQEGGAALEEGGAALEEGGAALEWAGACELATLGQNALCVHVLAVWR